MPRRASPLSRVVLSSAGLAQFTHSGSITGGATVDLSVRLHQVDDILKSLTVFDKEGAIGAVALPGRAPLEELFRDLPSGRTRLSLGRQSSTHWLAARWKSQAPLTRKGASSGWRPRRSRSLTTAAARPAIVSRS